MSAAALGGLSSAGNDQTPGVNPFAAINSEDFIKVLVSELSNQDPFKPNDSAQILEQLASLRSIESQASLQDALESLVLQNGVAQAGGMIGKMVQGLNDQNRQVAGLVTAVRVVDGQAHLELDTGATLALDRVQLIGGEAPEQE